MSAVTHDRTRLATNLPPLPHVILSERTSYVGGAAMSSRGVRRGIINLSLVVVWRVEEKCWVKDLMLVEPHDLSLEPRPGNEEALFTRTSRSTSALLNHV